MTKKTSIASRLPLVTVAIVGLWLVLQVALIVAYWDYPQDPNPDIHGYMQHALSNYRNHTTFPSRLNLYQQYIQSPGMVNYLLLQHALFGTTDFNIDKIFNLLLHIGILVNVYYLARRFFGQGVAYVATCIYCLLPSNIFIPIWHLSEIPYLFLALTGFSLSLHRRPVAIVAAAVLFAVAHTFRPLVLAFLLTSVVFYAIEWRRIAAYLLLLLPYAGILYAVGMHNKANTGYFVTSSTTGGYNLIMTANDKAHAWPEFAIFGDSTNLAYVPNRQHLTFAEKDSIYKARAMRWIRQHPVRYAALYVEKIGRLWAGDTWSIPPFSRWDNYDYIRVQPQEQQGRLVLIRRAIQAVEGLPYYVLFVVFCIALVRFRRVILTRKGLPLLIMALGTAGTCLFTVEIRFHYPYLFCMVLWASMEVHRWLLGYKVVRL